MVDINDNKKLEAEKAENEEDFEYEYEYVEVPEGEEIPESDEDYEYEYEYVEVPEGEESPANDTSFESADEEIPLEESSPALDDFLEEKKEKNDVENDIFEEIDLDSFLKETGGDVEEINLDDIIVENDDSEETHKIEEIDVDDFLSENEETSSLGIEESRDDTLEENLNFEYIENSSEEKSEFSKAEIETIHLDDIESEEISGAEFDENNERFGNEEGFESEPNVIDVDYEEEKLSSESEDGFHNEMDVEIDSDFKPIFSSNNNSENDEREEPLLNNAEDERSAENQILVSEDFAELLPIALGAEKAFPSEEDYENEEKKEINEISEKGLSQEVNFSVYQLSDDDYLNSIDFSKIVTKSDGVSVFYSTRKQNSISISDVDMKTGELSQWTLVFLDRKMVSLKENSENIFPLLKNSVRLAKLIKNGQERISFFNEEAYTVAPKTDSFGMVQGKFIVGPVEEDSGLLINDFINISLSEFYGKKLTFAEPVSGMLVGPTGSILYFSNIKNLILPREKNSDEAHSFEENLVKEVTGLKAFYEISSQASEEVFVGENGMDSIHINVGISTYGWNIVFDNDVTMSVKDLMTYQSRNGRMPSENGKIIYGRKAFGFEKIKSIALYETPQYFSYGK